MPGERINQVESVSEAWNVAQGFTHLKILKPLVEMDKLVKISIYGAESIEESMEYPEQLKTKMRIEAINRIIDLLREVIENTDFAMNKDCQKLLDDCERRVKLVEGVIHAVYRETMDQRTGETKIIINQEHFTTCLEELRDIKKEICFPLNKQSLIFPSSDEVDLDKLKEQLIYGG
jgi:hypothetical protein